MQEKAGEQGAAYIPMPKGRGFTPHVDKNMFRWHLKFLLKSGSTVCCHIDTKHASSDTVIREDLHLGSGLTVFPTNLPNQVVAVNMAEVSAFWISDKPFYGEEETK